MGYGCLVEVVWAALIQPQPALKSMPEDFADGGVFWTMAQTHLRQISCPQGRKHKKKTSLEICGEMLLKGHMEKILWRYMERQAAKDTCRWRLLEEVLHAKREHLWGRSHWGTNNPEGLWPVEEPRLCQGHWKEVDTVKWRKPIKKHGAAERNLCERDPRLLSCLLLHQNDWNWVNETHSKHEGSWE